MVSFLKHVKAKEGCLQVAMISATIEGGAEEMRKYK
jgi:hypothetical protein